MSRYDLYRASDSVTYMLDVQCDLLEGIDSRVVLPVIALSRAPKTSTLLNPLVEIDGELHVVMTQSLAAVPRAVLKKPVANLAHRADEITRALDLLFQGF